MSGSADEPKWMAELRAWSEQNPPVPIGDDPPPPWIKFPDIPRMSIGWRMGAGEDYKHDFYAWFRSLTPEQRADVRVRWPEPQEWAGYFDMLEER